MTVELTSCRDCGRPVRWVRCGRDRPVALDPEPHPLGCVVLDEFGRCGPAAWQPGTPDLTERFLRHQATCTAGRGSRTPALAATR
jgi:hypothetical protein